MTSSSQAAQDAEPQNNPLHLTDTPSTTPSEPRSPVFVYSKHFHWLAIAAVGLTQGDAPELPSADVASLVGEANPSSPQEISSNQLKLKVEHFLTDLGYDLEQVHPLMDECLEYVQKNGDSGELIQNKMEQLLTDAMDHIHSAPENEIANELLQEIETDLMILKNSEATPQQILNVLEKHQERIPVKPILPYLALSLFVIGVSKLLRRRELSYTKDFLPLLAILAFEASTATDYVQHAVHEIGLSISVMLAFLTVAKGTVNTKVKPDELNEEQCRFLITTVGTILGNLPPAFGVGSAMVLQPVVEKLGTKDKVLTVMTAGNSDLASGNIGPLSVNVVQKGPIEAWLWGLETMAPVTCIYKIFQCIYWKLGPRTFWKNKELLLEFLSGIGLHFGKIVEPHSLHSKKDAGLEALLHRLEAEMDSITVEALRQELAETDTHFAKVQLAHDLRVLLERGTSQGIGPLLQDASALLKRGVEEGIFTQEQLCELEDLDVFPKNPGPLDAVDYFLNRWVLKFCELLRLTHIGADVVRVVPYQLLAVAASITPLIVNNMGPEQDSQEKPHQSEIKQQESSDTARFSDEIVQTHYFNASDSVPVEANASYWLPSSEHSKEAISETFTLNDVPGIATVGPYATSAIADNAAAYAGYQSLDPEKAYVHALLGGGTLDFSNPTSNYILLGGAGTISASDMLKNNAIYGILPLATTIAWLEYKEDLAQLLNTQIVRFTENEEDLTP